MIAQPTFSIEATPAGRGFAHGDLVRSCVSWQDALDGAAYCADKSDHPTIFWAVERETAATGEQTSAAPVIRKEFFGSRSPFAKATRYAPHGTTQELTILFDNGGGILIMGADFCCYYKNPANAAEDVAALLNGAKTEDWEGNQPEFWRDRHPEDDLMDDAMARKIFAGSEWPERGAAWNQFCAALASQEVR